jgi:hypothetical protein
MRRVSQSQGATEEHPVKARRKRTKSADQRARERSAQLRTANQKRIGMKVELAASFGMQLSAHAAHRMSMEELRSRGVRECICGDLEEEVLDVEEDMMEEEEHTIHLLSLEARREKRIAENEEFLRAIGLLDAKRELLDSLVRAPAALPRRREVVPSEGRSSRAHERRQVEEMRTLTKEDVLRDGACAYGMRIGMYNQYRLDRREHFRGAWFYGCVVGAEFVESDQKRSLRIAFDVYHDEETDEWRSWPEDKFGNHVEVHCLAARGVAPWRLAPEQLPGGGASAPLGHELPVGVQCPNGCGLRLFGSVTSCQSCGSVVAGGEAA